MPEKVAFESEAGHTLTGLLDEPMNEPLGYALFAHCFSCSKDLRIAAGLARTMAQAGIGVLRFDFTGLGQSEGDFGISDFGGQTSDLMSAARYMESRGRPPKLIIGHSLGGTAVLNAAPDISTAKAVATIGSPCDPEHVRHHFENVEFDESGWATVRLGPQPFRISRAFMADVNEPRIRERIQAMRKPIMVMHSPKDEVVSIENAERIFKAARHPRSFVSLGDADHLVTKAKDAAFIGSVLASWGSYYLA